MSQLDVMAPVVCCISEAVPLRDDIEEDEEAFLYTDLLRHVGCPVGVLYEPVGELNEGNLVHMAKVVEAIGNSVE